MPLLEARNTCKPYEAGSEAIFRPMRAATCVFFTLLIAGCASQMDGVIQHNAPGFFNGLWNGMTAPFTFIWHFFDKTVSIYAVPNNGGWYNLGFMLGIGGFGLGSGATL